MLNTELIFWLPLIFFAMIEEFSSERRQLLTFQRWITNFSLLLINRYVLILIISLSINSFSGNIYYKAASQAYLFQDNFILTVVIALIGYDLIVYWEHRLFHTFKLLWRFHRIHHSDLELDISTSVRQHPVSSIISSLLMTALFVLSGISYEVLMLCVLISQLFSFFTHSNIKVNRRVEKIIRFVFITPNTHIVHHLAKLPYTNTNYGEVFCVWDKMFNTYRECPITNSNSFLLGLDNERDSQDQSVLKLLLNPFK